MLDLTPWSHSSCVSLSTRLSSAQSFSCVWFFVTPWTQHARPPCPSPTPEVYSTHVHQVGDAIQPAHPLSSPFPPALSLSQHQGLFQWVSSSHQVAKVLGVFTSTSLLPLNTQDWSPLGWTGWISLQSNGLSRVFSRTSLVAQWLRQCTPNGGAPGSIPGLGTRSHMLQLK